MARTMKDAVPKDDYERWYNGKPFRKRTEKKIEPPAPPPDPGPPKIEKESIKRLITSVRNQIRNADGVRWLIFTVTVETIDGKIVDGWMDEKSMIELRNELKR